MVNDRDQPQINDKFKKMIEKKKKVYNLFNSDFQFQQLQLTQNYLRISLDKLRNRY